MTSVAVTGRADLTDAQWAVLKPLLPVGKKPGRPPKWTKRQLIDGIRWRTRVGCPWRDVPPSYGPWQTIYGLFRRWQRVGVWAAILTGLQAHADAAGVITWDVSVDSTINRAHQHAAGARKRGMRRSSHPAGWPVPSPTITGWAARGVGGPPSCTWPASRDANRCRSCSPLVSGRTARSFGRYWPGFGYRAWVVGGPGPDRIGSWRTRPTAAKPTGSICVSAVSRARSR